MVYTVAFKHAKIFGEGAGLNHPDSICNSDGNGARVAPARTRALGAAVWETTRALTERRNGGQKQGPGAASERGGQEAEGGLTATWLSANLSVSQVHVEGSDGNWTENRLDLISTQHTEEKEDLPQTVITAFPNVLATHEGLKEGRGVCKHGRRRRGISVPGRVEVS